MRKPADDVLAAGGDPLLARAREAAAAARAWLLGALAGDHWRGELESNVSITAEYVLLRQALGLDLAGRREETIRHLASRQAEDGGFGLAAGLPPDVSTTAETYLALRLLGLPEDDPRMRRAERFVREAGGLARVRVFTRIHLALFGLFPWDAVPSVPAELVLLPRWAPLNVYRFSSWARSTLVPLLLVFHHRPVFALPGGRSAESRWLDHLWLDPAHKRVPYRASVLETLLEHGPGWKAAFGVADALLSLAPHAPRSAPARALRARALRACEAWILERQEPTGDWAGIFPPMLNGILALHAAGHGLDSAPVRRGLAAIEAFGWQDAEGFRMEACQSPVWDSILGLTAMLDAGADPADPRLVAVRRWILARQLVDDRGDWRVYGRGPPGGWSFEYANSWYPDVDDTAAVIIGLVKQDPASRRSGPVRRAVAWILGMQNPDGGWGAFDRGNDRLFLNELPFSDMDALCDPSSPDVTGRVVEAFALLDDPALDRPVRRAVAWLRRAQEPEGAFYGRWGVNYVYGTSNVLNGLARAGVPASDPTVARALGWLASAQNADGGFGEDLRSYADRAWMGRGPSTPSQTAWGAMGLLAHRSARDPAVRRAVAWLVDRQRREGDGGTWDEAAFTGTGFPRHFYLRYHLYRHYFPLAALGRFEAAARDEAARRRAGGAG